MVSDEWCFSPRYCTSKAILGGDGGGATCANEMNFVMAHAPCAGSIARRMEKNMKVIKDITTDQSGISNDKKTEIGR